MKINITSTAKYAVFAFVAFVSLQVSQAHALSASTGLDVKVDGNASGVGASAQVQTSAKATSSDSLINVGVNSDGSVNINGDSNSQASADAEVTSSVDTSSQSEVVVTYKRPAKFLGFIPVHISEKATVSADSSGKPVAKVHKSWWSFLATSNTNSTEFSSAIQSRVDNDASVSGSAELSASAKAQYVADIQAAAQATYGASVK